jgi:hypothetical protein
MMRISAFVRTVLLMMVTGSPLLLNAQFQEPTSEELKMTADPKAPGASAVYLYSEETTDMSDQFHSFYARIKVLTEKGKELATIHIPYEHSSDKITDIQGRTIHADGTVIPFTAKPSDLVEFKTKDYQLNSVVFTLPAVEVGSILEYRYRYKGYVPAPTWWIQQPYFVHRAYYVFHAGTYSHMLYLTRIGSGAKVVEKNGTFTLDMNDIPPQPDEDWMPPLNTLRWRVEFYYTYFDSGEEFWKSAQENWSTAVRDFINPTGQIKKAVAGIVAPEDSEEKKAEKIYAAVMKLENTDFTREKSKVERKKEKLKDINRAEDVWKQQGGTSNEIALLYVSLARAAGLKVSPMQVVNRNRAIFDRGYPTIRQLDDYIAVVELGGKDVYLDPGQKMCPYGMLHWMHGLAAGFRLSEKKAIIASTPGSAYTGNVMRRVAYLSIDTSGNVTGSVSFVMSGQEALYWRQLALENDNEEVKKQFNESMRSYLPEGVQANFERFQALEDYSSNLIGIVTVSGSLGTITGKHLFLPGLFFESRAKHPFVAQDTRTIPIDVHYARMQVDDVLYTLPPGYNIESMPQAAKNVWPDHAVLNINSRARGSLVNVVRSLAYNYTILDPKEYPKLHDFYQEIASADQQQLVLTRASQAKGN